MTLRLLPPPIAFRLLFVRLAHPNCDRCTYDRHECFGCGRRMGHGHRICIKCSHDMMKTIREMT